VIIVPTDTTKVRYCASIMPLKPHEQLKSLHASADAFSSPAPKPLAAPLPKDKFTSKKAKKRDPLAAIAHEKRYKARSQKGEFYYGMQRQKATVASAKAASDMAHRRTMVDWQKHAEREDEARSHYQRVGREIVIGACSFL
jgi:hypothetical protein